MGFADPDHQHPLSVCRLEKDANCFRCQLPITHHNRCYGCTHCNHFVHELCFHLPQNMTHPLHPQHSLTLLRLPSLQITDNCSECHKPFIGGYAYHCQACLKFNLHLKCFLNLNLEAKHSHPLRLSENIFRHGCRICGLLIDYFDSYSFACEDCKFYIHFDCTFLQPILKHRHVHELTFEYNYPEGSDMVYCDICLDKDDKELDRNLSYYYCKKCDYIAHVRCVTSQPAKVTTQLDKFVHEHPMIYVRKSTPFWLQCAACKCLRFDYFYYCNVCNYTLHKSCALFPRFIKHPRHEKNHTLSLRSCASQTLDGEQVSCQFCTTEWKHNTWIFQCSDCDWAVHLSCARQFKHPLYEGEAVSVSFYKDIKFRCNACGELGDGFRMSGETPWAPKYDLHLECFSLPGQIDIGCHSHSLYLVSSPTEIKSYLAATSQCDICHSKADPGLWVYCCEQCKYFAHLICVASELLPAPGLSNNLSNLASIKMCEKEKFREVIKPVDYSKLIREDEFYLPVFLVRLLINCRPPFGDHNGQPIALDVTDLDKPYMDVHCPECEQLISVQAYTCVYDWIRGNFKATRYSIQKQTFAGHDALALLDEKLADDLYCPICNHLIFPPVYSCAKCQIFFHKSCAELPRKYTEDAGHTFVLLSPFMGGGSLSNCFKCLRSIKGYAFFCRGCEISFDVTCALGAPLLRLEDQNHSLFAKCKRKGWPVKCKACRHEVTDGSTFFGCRSLVCRLPLHMECALLPNVVKHRIHQHPLVLEPHLDLKVDDYVCDVCEKGLNKCLWAYRCSDICGDRATSHVSCIITSNKKCHFNFDEECRYPDEFEVQLASPPRKVPMGIPGLTTALMNKLPKEQKELLRDELYLLVDELEHDYAWWVTKQLMEMEQAEILHLMESPDTLKAKVAETLKNPRSV